MYDFGLSDNDLIEQTNKSLLENAKDALIVGFEDYVNNKSPNARIKSSIRNIYAGLELLLKRYVNSFSPRNSHNVLLHIKSDYVIDAENGIVIAVGNASSNTIGFGEIKDRIKKYAPNNMLNEILVRVSKIKSIRNSIEHSHSEEPRHILKFSVLDAYEVIKDMDKLLDSDIHATILSASIKDDFERRLENYHKFKNEQPSNFSEEEAKYILCPACNSFAVQPVSGQPENNSTCDKKIECKDCTTTFVIIDMLRVLGASASFSDTHNNLKPFEYMHEKVLYLLTNEQIKTVANYLLDNDQIKWIAKDWDVHSFIIKVYNALHNCSKFKNNNDLKDIKEKLFSLYL